MEKDDVKNKVRSLIEHACPVKPALVISHVSEKDDLKNVLKTAIKEVLDGEGASVDSAIDKIQNALNLVEFVLCTFKSGAALNLFLNNEDAVAGLALSLRNISDGLRDAKNSLGTEKNAPERTDGQTETARRPDG